MKYILLKLEETKDDFKYSEEEIPHEREDRDEFRVSGGTGLFFLYYDASRKEEGKRLLLSHAKTEIQATLDRYTLLKENLETLS